MYCIYNYVFYNFFCLKTLVDETFQSSISKGISGKNINLVCTLGAVMRLI